MCPNEQAGKTTVRRYVRKKDMLIEIYCMLIGKIKTFVAFIKSEFDYDRSEYPPVSTFHPIRTIVPDIDGALYVACDDIRIVYPNGMSPGKN